MRKRIWTLAALLSLQLGGGNVDAQTAADSPEARRSINLEALSRLKGMDLEANPAVKAVVLKILDQAKGTPQFVELVRDFHIQGQSGALLEIAERDPSGPIAAEAMRMVLNDSGPQVLPAALLNTNASAIAEALGNTGDKRIVPLLMPIVSDNSKPLALRETSVRALVKVQEGANALLDAAKSQTLPDDLRPTASTELSGVRWETIKDQALKILPPGSQNSSPLPPTAELVKRKGDPKRGQAVFRRDSVGCYKCHQVNGEGTDFGPNLSEIGTKLAKDAIYVAILEPSAGISFGYEAWDIEFKNGDDALGLIVSETNDEIVLKTVGGLATRYKKTDVERRTKQKLSIMPAGLEKTMSEQDLIDLVEYLSSLKKVTQ